MEYGLIGEKLGHSFSKTVHSKLTDYNYELKEIKKEEFDFFMQKKDFKAINVTIPYKQDVIKYLDFISENAKKIGAVNTIVNKNGKLYGYNTDYLGLVALIKHNKMELQGKKVLILGSGGTSKTAKTVAEDLGAREVYRVSRKDSNRTITYNDAYKNHTDAQVIINTTPCGMYPNIDTCAIDISKFNNLDTVIDVVYNPLSTYLVVEAKKLGIKASGGIYMLVAQAAFAAEHFISKSFPESEINKIVNEIVKEKQNIVLIGMPGCGKSTIGKQLAKDLNKDFVDTDEEIINREGISISEIFSLKGETEFRKIESDVIREISSRQGLVIATGGGAILNSKNIDLLKENGIILFLDRDINDIVATDDRPLSSNREDLEKRYNERYPIYLQSADFRIECTNQVNENIKAIKEVF